MRQLPSGRRAIRFLMALCSHWGHVTRRQSGIMGMINILFHSLVLVLTISGCATIVDGGSQTVTFNSEPNRAKIFINGVQVGVTPLTTQVKRGKHVTMVAKKEGYQEQQVLLQTKTNTYFWLNALWGGGGLFSSTTDWVSDAMVEYSPNMYFISLDPLRKSETDSNRLNHEKQVRNFILTNHAHLAGDLARGEGEYLSSLSALLTMSATPRGEIVKTLQMLSESHQDPPSFANAVLIALLRG